MTISTDYDPASPVSQPTIEEGTLSSALKLAPAHRPLPNWVNEMNWTRRLWWHTKAYGTILGVALLAGGSLAVLLLHRQLRQLFR
jgi:hypothetical protein